MEYQEYLTTFKNNAVNHINETIEKIKEFSNKNHISTYVVGMSGGIDCAVTAALVKKAGYKVIALTMPYHQEESKQRALGVKDAIKQCEVLDIEIHEIDISKTVDEILKNYENDALLTKAKENKVLAKANILPRIRMTNLYYVAQANNALVLGTGNLSEYTMGYFTKWGDGIYDFNPIKEFTKSEIFILAEHLNIIDEIKNKLPSADLWDGQTDEQEMKVSYYYIDKYIRFPNLKNEYKDLIEAAIKKSLHKK